MRTTVLLACVAIVALSWVTRSNMKPPPDSLDVGRDGIRRVQIWDRQMVPLTVTYQNAWNLHDRLPLHEIPPVFQRAFVESEDRRFFVHAGVDWMARAHALVQNVLARRAVRGASTITEQVIRMLHPRPRTVWSRWVEGFEAMALERRFSKSAILEFYLNQVPYARQRRGVLQASRLYFGRDPDTLSLREMMALVVLVRAPSGMDLSRPSSALDRASRALARRLAETGDIERDRLVVVMEGPLRLKPVQWSMDAGHFVQHVMHSPAGARALDDGRLVSTLDSSLQVLVQEILDRRLKDLASEEASDGAALVVDHRTDEILVWVNGGGLSAEKPGGWIDAVTVRRQPGSTLKPFLYGLAMEMGWTAATCIEDSPLAESVGGGLHSFRNYSGVHYGRLRLREALGNSLNIPALRAIRYTGTAQFLERLHLLGVRSLDRPSEFYGEGLALGDGEVSLLELVRAYAVLARGGEARPLRMALGPEASGASASKKVFREDVASIIGSILSDPEARRLEFGAGNVLSFPVQTAVKTGTSSDHRDAWAVGFSATHTVGVWMGNLDRRPTRSVTGTTGPGLVLRTIFAEINRFVEPRPLRLSSGLESRAVCRVTGLRASPRCPKLDEWFSPNTAPARFCAIHGDDIRSPSEDSAPGANVSFGVPGEGDSVRGTLGSHTTWNPARPAKRPGSSPFCSRLTDCDWPWIRTSRMSSKPLRFCCQNPWSSARPSGL
ncbi:MAG: transglycosylase domain-containing protein [Syntrophobacteraceae bacterium]